MLSMPSKPPKKVRITPTGEGRYTLTFLTLFKDQAEFEKTIENDIRPCLGENDAVTDRDWESKSLTLVTDSLEAFQHKLIYHVYVIKRG